MTDCGVFLGRFLARSKGKDGEERKESKKTDNRKEERK